MNYSQVHIFHYFHLFLGYWFCFLNVIPLSELWSEVKWLSRVRLFATPWTAAYQAPPSMGFSRQEYWSGLPLPSPNKCKVAYMSIWSDETPQFFPPCVCVWVCVCACVRARSVVSDSLHPHGLLACQAPLSMGFPRQEYWTGLPFPTPGDLPDLGIEPVSPVSCIGQRILFHWATGKPFPPLRRRWKPFSEAKSVRWAIFPGRWWHLEKD